MRWEGGWVWVRLGKWPLLTLPEKVQLMGKNKIKGKKTKSYTYVLPTLLEALKKYSPWNQLISKYSKFISVIIKV
jgi:hypothetical protein